MPTEPAPWQLISVILLVTASVVAFTVTVRPLVNRWPAARAEFDTMNVRYGRPATWALRVAALATAGYAVINEQLLPFADAFVFLWVARLADDARDRAVETSRPTAPAIRQSPEAEQLSAILGTLPTVEEGNDPLDIAELAMHWLGEYLAEHRPPIASPQIDRSGPWPHMPLPDGLTLGTLRALVAETTDMPDDSPVRVEDPSSSGRRLGSCAERAVTDAAWDVPLDDDRTGVLLLAEANPVEPPPCRCGHSAGAHDDGGTCWAAGRRTSSDGLCGCIEYRPPRDDH